ncbi:DMT family transporter [Pseudonocardia sp. TRM90224]|uniref:DMT family transporter n=1 Tax=Pseudonocardia sp. TRM90224 TaxID=2812678 RepID=UPI001E291199|nr:DMT family transporter [Pseudonocardia sp. TRM90224]
MTRRGWLLFLGLSVIWGVPYLMIRVAVEDLDPLIVAFARTALGALLLLPIALYQRTLWPVFRRWKPLLVYTLIEISGPWLLLGHAETRLTSSTTGLLIALVPPIAAVIVTRLGHDRLDARRLIGLGIGLGGVAALVGLDIHFSDLPAIGAVVLTAIGYAIGPIIINRKLNDLPPMGVVTASLIVAAVIYAPFAPFVWPSAVTLDAGLSVLGLAVICTALAFLVLFALIAEAGPARATVITYISPAVSLLLGVVVLSEPLTTGMLIGFPLVILGSIMGTARQRKPSIPPPVPVAVPEK